MAQVLQSENSWHKLRFNILGAKFAFWPVEQVARRKLCFQGVTQAAGGGIFAFDSMAQDSRCKIRGTGVVAQES